MPTSVPMRALACLFAAIFAASTATAASYKGAIVVDVATGRTLFEEGADLVTPPASVTKLMTFLLVSEELTSGRLSPATEVTVNAEAARMGGSQVYLAENEVFTVEDLLWALMVSSANDAAMALAIHVSGSRDAFVARMNARARELEMTNTTFTSPHGLPPSNRRIEDGDLTTARDLARLSVYLLERTNIIHYTSTKDHVFRPGPRQIDMRNHNNLLGKVAGVDGLKTGFTRGAGFCLAATALRDGRRVVAVTMGSPESRVRDLEIADLLEKAFADLPPIPIITPGAASTPANKPAAPTAESKAPSPAAPLPAASRPPLITPVPDEDPPAVRFVMPGRKT